MQDSFIGSQLCNVGNLRSSDDLVWVHSSFRVSSTWFWSRFRRNPNVVAYQEIFHEMLGSLTPEEAAAFGYRDWNSGHPPSAPYFLEYAPFLLKGWLQCDDSMAFGSYIPRSADRSISSAEAAHVEKLINNARVRGRTPILTDVRTLGRVHGLRRRFGGYHILLYRNLFRQWCSYSGQELQGNAYFIDRMDQVIGQNTHDAFLSMLSGMFPPGVDGKKCCRWEYFLRFVLFHLYLYALALPDCGLDVCVDHLATDRKYRCDTEEQIGAATGLTIDLTDCHTNIEVSALPFDGRQGEALETLRILAGAIPAFLPGWSNRQQDFLDAQIYSLESELDRYVFYTQATVRHASAGFADLAAAREAALGYADAVQQQRRLVSEVAELQARVASLAELAEQSRTEAERSDAAMGELNDRLRVLSASTARKDEQLAEVGRLRVALCAMQQSTSWRITAPLRALKRLALGTS